MLPRAETILEQKEDAILQLELQDEGSYRNSILLRDAILEGKKEEVLRLIKSGISIDALLPTPKSFSIKKYHSTKNSGDIKVFFTPIHLAIRKLDFDMVKFLLENGADPYCYTSEESSTLEVLLITVSSRIVEDFLKTKENYIPKVFQTLHINAKLKRTIELTQKQQETTNNILEILLAYGLDTAPSWSPHFLAGYKDLTSAAEYIHIQRDTYERLNLLPDIMAVLTKVSVEDTNKSSLGKKISINYSKAQGWFLKTIVQHFIGEKRDRKKKETALDTFVETFHHLPQQLEIAEKDIIEEKTQLQVEYMLSLDNTIKILPRVLLDIICDFLDNDISGEVYSQRQKRNKITNFWQPAEYKPSIDKEKIIQAFEIKSRIALSLFKAFKDEKDENRKENINKISELITEYLVEEKEQMEPLKQLNISFY